MTLKTASINSTLVGLSRAISNPLKNIRADWGYMLAVTFNQELRHGHPPDVTEIENHQVTDHAISKDDFTLASTATNISLINDTEEQISERDDGKVKDLISELEPHLPDICDILSTFYDYKNNEDDIELDEMLGKQFKLSPEQVKDLVALFTILAHEVEYDRHLYESLIPSDKTHIEFHPDEQLYLLSDHLHRTTKASRRRSQNA